MDENKNAGQSDSFEDTISDIYKKQYEYEAFNPLNILIANNKSVMDNIVKLIVDILFSKPKIEALVSTLESVTLRVASNATKDPIYIRPETNIFKVENYREPQVAQDALSLVKSLADLSYVNILQVVEDMKKQKNKIHSIINHNTSIHDESVHDESSDKASNNTLHYQFRKISDILQAIDSSNIRISYEKCDDLNTGNKYMSPIYIILTSYYKMCIGTYSNDNELIKACIELLIMYGSSTYKYILGDKINYLLTNYDELSKEMSRLLSHEFITMQRLKRLYCILKITVKLYDTYINNCYYIKNCRPEILLHNSISVFESLMKSLAGKIEAEEYVIDNYIDANIKYRPIDLGKLSFDYTNNIFSSSDREYNSIFIKKLIANKNDNDDKTPIHNKIAVNTYYLNGIENLLNDVCVKNRISKEESLKRLSDNRSKSSRYFLFKDIDERLLLLLNILTGEIFSQKETIFNTLTDMSILSILYGTNLSDDENVQHITTYNMLYSFVLVASLLTSKVNNTVYTTSMINMVNLLNVSKKLNFRSFYIPNNLYEKTQNPYFEEFSYCEDSSVGTIFKMIHRKLIESIKPKSEEVKFILNDDDYKFIIDGMATAIMNNSINAEFCILMLMVVYYPGKILDNPDNVVTDGFSFRGTVVGDIKTPIHDLLRSCISKINNLPKFKENIQSISEKTIPEDEFTELHREFMMLHDFIKYIRIGYDTIQENITEFNQSNKKTQIHRDVYIDICSASDYFEETCFGKFNINGGGIGNVNNNTDIKIF